VAQALACVPSFHTCIAQAEACATQNAKLAQILVCAELFGSLLELVACFGKHPEKKQRYATYADIE
jgi:hypothetical protein